MLLIKSAKVTVSVVECIQYVRRGVEGEFLFSRESRLRSGSLSCTLYPQLFDKVWIALTDPQGPGFHAAPATPTHKP